MIRNETSSKKYNMKTIKLERGQLAWHEHDPPGSLTRSRGAIARPRFDQSPPREGWGSADRRPVLARHRDLRLLTGRGTCEMPRVPCDRDARLSALLPWRF